MPALIRLAQAFVVPQNHAAARAAQRFVGRRRHDMRMGQGIGIEAGRDKAGEMRHVDEEIGADLVGDRAHRREIDGARIGGAAGDDHARPFAPREIAHLVEIDAFGLAADAIGDDSIVAPGQRRRMAVADVAAGGDIHREDHIAEFQEAKKHAGVGVGARMRLHIGEATVEEFLRALNGERLDGVGELRAAIIARKGQALDGLVGEDRALRLQHEPRDDVFGGDEFDAVLLAPQLAGDGRGELGIGGEAEI